MDYIEEKTKTFIEGIEGYLIEQHGEIKPRYKGIIEILKSQYGLYLMAMADIKESGITVPGAKEIKKNPAVDIALTTMSKINVYLNQLGIGAGIEKKLNVRSKEDADADDYIGQLTE